MSGSWTLAIYENKQLVRQIEVPGRAELGRQNALDEPLDSCRSVEGRWRVVVASKEVTVVSRRFLLVEPQPGGTFRLTNLSDAVSVHLADGRQLPPSTS